MSGRDGRGARRAREADGGEADRTPPRPAAAERARRIRAERAAQRERLLPEEAGRRRPGSPAGPARRTRGATAVAERPRAEPRHVDRRFRVRRRIALAALMLVVLAALGGGLWAVLVFTGIARVENVEITGTLALAQDDVRAAAAVETGAPLATADTAGIASRVAALPAVASVEVGRRWPHTVEIAIQERTPVALARTTQGVTFVDAEGVPYQKAPDIPPALPLFGFGAVGPDDPSTKAALTVLAALPPDLRARVTTVDVDSPTTEPTVRLGLGAQRVLFGSADRAAQKVAVLVPLLTQKGTTFDVASPELPTITR